MIIKIEFITQAGHKEINNNNQFLIKNQKNKN